MTYEEIKDKITSAAKEEDIKSILSLFTFENVKIVTSAKVTEDLKQKRYDFLRGSVKEFANYSNEDFEKMIDVNIK